MDPDVEKEIDDKIQRNRDRYVFPTPRETWQRERCWRNAGYLHSCQDRLEQVANGPSTLTMEAWVLKMCARFIKAVLAKWKDNYDISFEQYKRKA